MEPCSFFLYSPRKELFCKYQCLWGTMVKLFKLKKLWNKKSREVIMFQLDFNKICQPAEKWFPCLLHTGLEHSDPWISSHAWSSTWADSARQRQILWCSLGEVGKARNLIHQVSFSDKVFVIVLFNMLTQLYSAGIVLTPIWPAWQVKSVERSQLEKITATVSHRKVRNVSQDFLLHKV